MSKKKQTPHIISEEAQLEALEAISKMSPEQQQELLAFAEEFEQMPEELQDMMVDFFNMIEHMPKSEKEEFLQQMEQLDSILHVDDSDDNSVGDFFESTASDEYNIDSYPHFLPRQNVQKYTLRVTLRGIKPAIYRKFCVPSNVTLRHPSELILELMGWTNEHLNQFRKGDTYYAPAYQREHEMPVLFGPARNYNQEEYTLSDLLSEKGKSIEWEYDFGDSWYHDVKLSSVGDYKQGEPLVSFIKGERECPPEDCGGIWGYQDLLAIYEKKKSRKRLTSEEKERLEWYEMDEYFDPEYFNNDFAHIICEDYCE